MRSIDELLNLDYRISLEKEDGSYFATVDELPGCMADGRTPNQAVANLRNSMRSWMESRRASCLEIPEPRAAGDYSGKVLVRMPKSLHHKLSMRAATEGVSLNQYIVSALSEACGRASGIEYDQIAAAVEGYSCRAVLARYPTCSAAGTFLEDVNWADPQHVGACRPGTGAGLVGFGVASLEQHKIRASVVPKPAVA
jgi:antitoxin HicB